MNYQIDESQTINVNGQRYYIRVRTCNVGNTVVLFLHGGCGSPDRGARYQVSIAACRTFTLVAFDQRGAGLANNKKEAKTLDLTEDIYVDDVHNGATYLKQTFNKEKIIIVCHSFGSTLGVCFVQKYPEDILASVGIGQCVDNGNCHTHGLCPKQKG